MKEQRKPELVICMGSSCFSRGNKHTVSLIKGYLKERGLEEKCILRGSHCFGECEKGPVLLLDGQKHTRIHPENIAEILDHHFFSGS